MPDDDEQREAPTRPGLRRRLRYQFDNLLARGTTATLLWLGLVTIAAVLVSALLLRIFGVDLSGSENNSWIEDFWQSLLRTLDSGTMANDTGWGRRLLALAVTIFGLLVAGTLIGIIATGVEDRTDRMRRGRSVVIENDHWVILGSSDRLPMVVEQLVRSNARRDSQTIVILADRDPAELHDEVHRMLSDRRNTKVVFRSGDPTRRSDLELVRLSRARSIIVLADEAGTDTSAVKTVLAVHAELGGLDRDLVVEVNEPSTGLRLASACGPHVHPLATVDAIGRLAAFSLRQRGISGVVNELTDFYGDDIQVVELPDAAGLTFGEIVGRYANARPFGLIGTDGTVDLAPAASRRVAPTERVALIADDASDLELSSAEWTRTFSNASAITPLPAAEPTEDHVLVVGWSPFGARLLEQWAAFTSPASTLEVAVDPELGDTTDVVVAGFEPERLTVTTVVPPDRFAALFPLNPTVTTVVLLAHRGCETADEADSHTVLELLHLRRHLEERVVPSPRIVVELLDADNAEIAELPGVDDFIVSGSIGSQLLAQLADDPQRRAVLLQLYAAGGAGLRLIRADQLGIVDGLRFGDIVSAALASGLLALGWRRSTRAGGELMLNPHLDTHVRLEPDDEIVVIG
jgi:voltage-gated potassium channel Kch